MEEELDFVVYEEHETILNSFRIKLFYYVSEHLSSGSSCYITPEIFIAWFPTCLSSAGEELDEGKPGLYDMKS